MYCLLLIRPRIQAAKDDSEESSESDSSEDVKKPVVKNGKVIATHGFIGPSLTCAIFFGSIRQLPPLVTAATRTLIANPKTKSLRPSR